MNDETYIFTPVAPFAPLKLLKIFTPMKQKIFTPDKHKTYYHISPVAGLAELRPHVPSEMEDECDMPRVCVCPSVPLAYGASGIAGWIHDANIHVYAIHQEPDVTPDKAFELGTLDALDVAEHWYLTAVQCEYVGTMEQWRNARGHA